MSKNRSIKNDVCLFSTSALLAISFSTSISVSDPARGDLKVVSDKTMSRYILTDLKYIKALGLDPIIAHESSQTALVKTTETDRTAIENLAHENGACAGYELLPESEIKNRTKLESKTVETLFAKDARRQAIEAFRIFDKQLDRDHAYQMAANVGIGLPDGGTKAPSGSLVPDPKIEKAINQVSEENLKATVNFLSSFESRNHKSGDGQKAILAFKQEVERVLANGKNPWTLSLIQHRSTPMNSLKLTIPGSSGSSEIIVAGAHIDSINQSFWGGSKKAPGADDNASGSANILELARILVHDQQPVKTVELYWYAGEEGGLLGSAEIAKEAKDQGKNIVGVLQLDMTLFPGNGEFTVTNMTDFTSQSLRDHLVNLNAIYSIGAKFIEDKCGYGCSDHASWYKNGFQTVMPAESTMRNMNGQIHTERDVVNSQSSFRHSAIYTKLAVGFVLTL